MYVEITVITIAHICERNNMIHKISQSLSYANGTCRSVSAAAAADVDVQ